MNNFISTKFFKTEYLKNIKYNSSFDWKKYSYYLCKHHFEDFNIWWDPDKFDWEKNSSYLCEYCNDYFDIWWDSNKVNWSKIPNVLMKSCLKYVHIWFDVDKILKYFKKDDIYKIIKYNEKNNFIVPKEEIIKLRLLMEV